MRKYKKIEERKLKQISKEVAHRLNREFGIPFSCEEGISSSKTKYKKYYLCESKRNMSCLYKLNKAK